MSLSSSISGAPAAVGTRIIAFSIDAVLLAGLAIGAAVLLSPAFGLAVAAEALLGMWILQARTGSSPGAALFGLRVSRDDRPFSPGAGRTFVRGSLLLLGAFVLLAGAWIVVASAAWDRSGRLRSWSDKASQTVVVVPARQSTHDPYALASPTVMGRVATGSRTPKAPRDEPSALAASELPMAPAWDGAIVAPPQVPLSDTATGVGAGAGAVAQPSDPQPGTPTAPVSSADELLVVFDTGQRVQVPLPVTVNFGRAPVPVAADDVLVAVDDPDRMVSKTHLRLEHDGEYAWVTDAGSTNGSEIVGEDGTARPLAAGDRTLLDDGDRVRIGERIFTVSRLIGRPT